MVHLFEMHGKHIAYDSESCSINELDVESSDVLRLYIQTGGIRPSETELIDLSKKLDLEISEISEICDDFDTLIKAGVKVHEYGPRMLHTKALLVDDHLVILGSANFDHRSFRLNFEVSALLDNTNLAATLEQHLRGEFESAPVVQRDKGRSLFAERLPEALARLLSPLL